MKKIRIICEEAYAESIWCKQLLAGLLKELKKHRAGFLMSTQAERGDAACMLGMSTRWLQEQTARCNALGVTPVVLTNQSCRSFPGEYHLICADAPRTAAELGEAFARAGRSRIALYGAGVLTELDRERTEIFSGLVSDKADIYPNTGNLEHCFRAFLPKAAGYDAVVCINGYAAVSLVKKLEKEQPALLETLVIVSFEEVLRHSKYQASITTVDPQLENYGKAAFSVLEMAEKCPWISLTTIGIRSTVCEIRKKNHETDCFMEEEPFYEDPELVSMAKIEQLLCDADDLDHHIIAMLLDHATYGEIAESCYMTEGNVKYRVKKYMSICDCKSRKELFELLQEYLQ